MKTLRIIIGIISIVLSVIVCFQSCAVGLGNALFDSEEDSGSVGVLVAIFLLIAGIVGIATRKSRAGGIVSTVFYALGGLIGISSYGNYSDLAVWSVISLLFAAAYLIASIFTKKPAKKVPAEPEE